MSIKPNSNPTSSSFPLFDRSRLRLDTLSVREHGLTLDCVKPLLAVLSVQNDFIKIAAAIKTARKNQRSVILMMGAHVLRAGVQRYLIDLMEKGYINCLAMNGAGVIHDFEFALIGATTENVARYISDGRFGFWRETGIVNEIVADAAEQGLGLGEAVGR